MTNPESDVDDQSRDVLVIDRAAGNLDRVTVRDCGGDETRDLLMALVGRGWNPVHEHGTAELVLGHDADVSTVVTAVRSDRPTLVAVRETVPTWPGWDPDLLAIGYVPCQFTGAWRLYVREDRGPVIGPLVSRPVTIEDLAELGGTSHDELVEQIVRWRTAAVSRWAELTDRESDDERAQIDGLRDQLAAAHRELLAVRATSSWRVTAPLRALKRLRLGLTSR